jgi:hypothetical protein
LTEDLKAALKILQDQKTNQRNQSGELIVEPGLCSLIDNWEADREEEEDYD